MSEADSPGAPDDPISLLMRAMSAFDHLNDLTMLENIMGSRRKPWVPAQEWKKVSTRVINAVASARVGAESHPELAAQIGFRLDTARASKYYGKAFRAAIPEGDSAFDVYDRGKQSTVNALMVRLLTDGLDMVVGEISPDECFERHMEVAVELFYAKTAMLKWAEISTNRTLYAQTALMEMRAVSPDPPPLYEAQSMPEGHALARVPAAISLRDETEGIEEAGRELTAAAGWLSSVTDAIATGADPDFDLAEAQIRVPDVRNATLEAVRAMRDALRGTGSVDDAREPFLRAIDTLAHNEVATLLWLRDEHERALTIGLDAATNALESTGHPEFRDHMEAEPFAPMTQALFALGLRGDGRSDLNFDRDERGGRGEDTPPGPTTRPPDGRGPAPHGEARRRPSEQREPHRRRVSRAKPAATRDESRTPPDDSGAQPPAPNARGGERQSPAVGATGRREKRGVASRSAGRAERTDGQDRRVPRSGSGTEDRSCRPGGRVAPADLPSPAAVERSALPDGR